MNSKMNNKTSFDLTCIMDDDATVFEGALDATETKYNLAYERFYYGQKIFQTDDEIYCEKLAVEGGFAEIHKVYDKNKDSYYIMKLLKKEFLNNKAFLQSFKEEAKILAELPFHPNLVKPINFLTRGRLPYLFTEYIEGKTLDQLIRPEQKVSAIRSEQKASKASSNVSTLVSQSPPRKQSTVFRFDNQLELTIFIEICRGMDFLYREKGIVHLDLKPKNILINSMDGRPKIIDFGLSRSSAHKNFTTQKEIIQQSAEWEASDGTGYLDIAGKVIGTLAYMSPEHFKGLEHCDTRSDIYSVGVLMYEFVSGHKPFQVATASDFKVLHCEAAPAPLKGRDKELEKIIMKCLEKDSINRFQTFEELLKVLEELYFEQTGRHYLMVLDGDESEVTAEDWCSRAAMQINFGNNDKGLQHVEKALKIDPDHVEANGIKAISLYRSGKSGKALAAVEKALSIEPDLGSLLNNKAAILEGLSRLDEAVECRIKALECEKSNKEYSYTGLAGLYSQMGRYLEAEYTLNDAESEFGISSEIEEERIKLYFNTKRKDLGLKLASKYLLTDWEGYYHHLIAYFYYQAGDMEQAEFYGKKALEICPDNPLYAGFYLEVAVAVNYDEAIEFGLRWKEENEPTGYFLNNLGIALDNAKRHEEASGCFHNALEKEPGDAFIAGNLIYSLTEAGKDDEAIEFGLRWKEENKPNGYFLNRLGIALYNAKRYEEAAECYHNALEKEPEDADYAGNLIDSLNNLGKYDEAIEFGLRWKEEKEPNGYLLNKLGSAFYNAKRYEEASECYRNALEKEPGNAIYAGNLISSFINSGKYDEAIEFGLRWKEEKEPTGNFLNWLGMAFNNAKRYEEATECFYDALEKEPEEAIYAGHLIGTLSSLGKYDEVIEFGLRWKEEKEPTGYFFSNLGIAFANTKRYEEASGCFYDALEKEPEHGIYASYLIDSLTEAGKHDEAIEFGVKWKEEKEPTRNFLNNLGIALYKTKRYEEATECYRNALKKGPENAIYAGNLIDSLRNSGKYDEAIEFGVKWKEEKEPTGNFLNNLGIALYRTKRYEEASGCFYDALKKNPEDANYADNLIDSLTEAGKHYEAIEFGLRWKEENRPNAYFINRLGDVYYNIGIYDEASECYREALNIEPGKSTYATNFICALTNAERYDEAIEFGLRWKKGNEASGSFLNALGAALFFEEWYEESAICCSEAVEKDPSVAQYVSNLEAALTKLARLPANKG